LLISTNLMAFNFFRSLRNIVISVILLGNCLYSTPVWSQRKYSEKIIDSLTKVLPTLKQDSTAVRIINRVSQLYSDFDTDKGVKWAAKELILSKKIGWLPGQISAYNDFGNNYFSKPDYPNALLSFFKALKLVESIKNNDFHGVILANIGNVYFRQNDYQRALEYYNRANDLFKIAGNMTGYG